METDIIQFLMFRWEKKGGKKTAYIFSSATIATLDIVRAICKKQVTIATLTIQAVTDHVSWLSVCRLIITEI